MSWLCHDSQKLFYRNPFGAVPCRTAITLRLKAISYESLDSVQVRVWKDDREYNYEMKLIDEKENEKIFEAKIQTPALPGLLWYYFVVVRRGRAYYYGNNLQRLGGEGLVQEMIPPAYQVTVYKEDFSTPPWFRSAVMYQIFVDRFCNGNEDGRVPEPKEGALLHANWDDTPLYVREPGSNGIWRWTFFGGNLQGIIKKLPYLHKLGIRVLYLNPIFEASSNHKYDTGDYKKIDAMFGTNEVFRQLCHQAKGYGIYVILDGVFSHTGSDSIYFNREGSYPGLGAYQSPESPYYKWYRFTRYPYEYEAWWGIGTLPNVNEMEPSYLDFIMDAEDSVVKYWMEMGAKGWRLDVADELPDAFIRRLRQAVKEVDEEAVLIGEVWEDASNKVSYGQHRSFLWGEELDSVMNYPFRRILLDYILGSQSAEEMHRALMNIYENYPAPVFYSCMNLLGSHDVPRILTLLGEAPPADRLGEREKAAFRLNPGQRRLALDRLKLLALFQMTFPGVPCIYYGDEAGMEGYADPYNRGPFPWGREEEELLAWYRQVIALRNKSQALQKGEWIPLQAREDIYAYLRRFEKEHLVAVFNRSATQKKSLSLDLGAGAPVRWREEIGKSKGARYLKGLVEVTLEPLEGKALMAI